MLGFAASPRDLTQSELPDLQNELWLPVERSDREKDHLVVQVWASYLCHLTSNSRRTVSPVHVPGEHALKRSSLSSTCWVRDRVVEELGHVLILT